MSSFNFRYYGLSQDTCETSQWGMVIQYVCADLKLVVGCKNYHKLQLPIHAIWQYLLITTLGWHWFGKWDISQHDTSRGLKRTYNEADPLATLRNFVTEHLMKPRLTCSMMNHRSDPPSCPGPQCRMRMRQSQVTQSPQASF